jgi:hypothetical protein
VILIIFSRSGLPAAGWLVVTNNVTSSPKPINRFRSSTSSITRV